MPIAAIIFVIVFGPMMLYAAIGCAWEFYSMLFGQIRDVWCALRKRFSQ